VPSRWYIFVHALQQQERTNCSLLVLGLRFMQVDDPPNFIQLTIGFSVKTLAKSLQGWQN